MPTPTCKGCGLCCLNMPTPPFVPSELDKVPASLMAEIDAYLDGPLFNDEHPGLWLNRATGECKHYDYRPGICRDFVQSGPSCREARTAADLTIEGWPILKESDDE